jgi:TP901 family phage tail tape measure protein
VADEVIGRGLIEILPDFKKFGKELSAGMKTAKAQLDGSTAGLKASAGTIFNSMAKVGKGVSVVGVGVAAASVKMAGTFQAETAVLQTAAGESAKNLATVRKGILSISEGTGTGIKNLTDGMYTIEKAGYRGAAGLGVLKAAAEGAKEENAQLSDVTNAMTSVMASYHLKATDATRVMNALKTAAGEGKITMEQFSGALSTVLPIASANKISFAQVAGAVATLTQHGTSANEATQELAATIRQLAAPNNVAVKEMARFGITAQDVSLNLGKKGLTGTINELVQAVLTKMGPSGKILLSSFNTTQQASTALNAMFEKMPKSLQDLATQYKNGKIASDDWKMAIKGLPVDQKNLISQYVTLTNKNKGFSDELRKGGPATKTFTEAIKKMSGGAIGLNTVLQLSGESQAGFQDRVNKVSKSYNNASKEVEGWKTTQGLFNTQLARMKQTVEVLMIDLGTKLIPILQTMITWLGKNKDAVYLLAGAIGTVLTLSVVAFAAKTVVSAAKIVTSFAKIGVSAVTMGVNFARGFASASAAASSSSGLAGTLGGSLARAFDGIRLRAMYAADAIRTSFASGGIRTAMTSTGNAVKTFGKNIASVASSAGKSAWTGIVSGLSSVGKGMKAAAIATRDFTVATAQSAAAGAKAALVWTAQRIKTLAQAAATGIATAAQWLWNTAMDANPITLVVIAIAALVAAIVYVATQTDWFQKLWKDAWSGITIAFNATWTFIRDHWKLILAILTGPVGGAVIFILSHWKMILSGIESVFNWIKGHWVLLVEIITGPIGIATTYVVQHWQKIKDGASAAISAVGRFFSNLGHTITSSVGSLSKTLYNAGANLIHGLISGAQSVMKGIKNWATGIKNSIVGAIKDVFKISSPSRVMMTMGGHMMTGLLHGMLKGKKVLHSAVKGLFSSPLDAAKNLVKNGVNLSTEWVGKIFGGGGADNKGYSSKAVGSAQSFAKAILGNYNWGPNEFGPLKSLWNGESGWNYQALNKSSGAYGIPQALPASKMASAGSDWKTNAQTQILWGLGYIRDRYGTPAEAWAKWQARSPHWYDSGGWLPTGLSMVMNGTGRPERIRNSRQEAALGNGTGAGVTINLTVVNKGVISNKQDAMDFLVSALDTLNRQHRLPKGLGGS